MSGLITVADVMALRPCYEEAKVRALYPEGHCTPAELGADTRIPTADRLWVCAGLLVQRELYPAFLDALRDHPATDTHANAYANAYARADAYAERANAYARAERAYAVRAYADAYTVAYADARAERAYAYAYARAYAYTHVLSVMVATLGGES